MRKQTKYWTQRDGTKIRICDMTDSHLSNSIDMCVRVAKKNFESEMDACLSISFQGEMAQDSQQHFINNARWDDYLPEIYDNLVAESMRRKTI